MRPGSIVCLSLSLAFAACTKEPQNQELEMFGRSLAFDSSFKYVDGCNVGNDKQITRSADVMFSETAKLSKTWLRDELNNKTIYIYNTTSDPSHALPVTETYCHSGKIPEGLICDTPVTGELIKETFQNCYAREEDSAKTIAQRFKIHPF